jgi:multicomponent Na+:H+ antiporter subunit D
MTPVTLVPLVVLLPLAGAAVTLMFPRRPRVQRVLTFLTLSLVVVVGALLTFFSDAQGALVMEIGGWNAPIGITLVADRLASILVTVSAVVLLSVLIFSIGQGLADGDEEAPVSIYFPSYLVLAAGVSDAFVAGDLFNLYVAFEILLVASYVLLTMGGTAARIRAGVTYIVVSLVSSVFFLAAIGLMYGATGTVNMAQLSSRIAALPDQTQLTLNLILLVAFGVKAAIFPLSLWLPDSYPTAPAPVTAVFAGLLTKVGIYAIARSQTLIFVHSDVNTLLMWCAGLTLVVGIFGAVSQRDIKRTLSFVLISHIGYLLFGIALGTSQGYGATVYYIVHHIIVQTTMFLAVGLVERIGGSSSLARLGGLLKQAPVVAVLYFIPMLNLGGIPPFSGFLGKLGLFTAGASAGTEQAWWLIGIGAFVSLITLYALSRTWSLAFWRPQATAGEPLAPIIERLAGSPEEENLKDSKRVPKLMTLATFGMVMVSIALTVFAGPLASYSERAGAVLSDPDEQAAWYFHRPATEEAP